MVLHRCICSWRAQGLSREFVCAVTPSCIFNLVHTHTFLSRPTPNRHSDMQKVKAVFKRMFTEPHAKVIKITSSNKNPALCCCFLVCLV